MRDRPGKGCCVPAVRSTDRGGAEASESCELFAVSRRIGKEASPIRSGSSCLLKCADCLPSGRRSALLFDSGAAV